MLLLLQLRLEEWCLALEAPVKALRRKAVLRIPVCEKKAAMVASFFREFVE